MTVTLVLPGALALIIWRYSHHKNEEHAEMIKDVQNLIRQINQEKQNRRFFALYRLRLDVNQIIHHLQDMEFKLDNSDITDSQILSCLHNARAQIRDIEDISKIASSDVPPSITNTLRKRCDFLSFYSTTYKIRETIGPKQVGVLQAFEESFMEISLNFKTDE